MCFTGVDDHRLMRRQEVLQVTGLSKSTLHAMVARKEFPAPVRIGLRAVAWRAWEVMAWIKSRPLASETTWR